MKEIAQDICYGIGYFLQFAITLAAAGFTFLLWKVICESI